MKNLSDIFAWLLISIGIAITWYIVWVGPHDAYLASMMDCMEQGGDVSEMGYDRCAEEYRNESR